MQDGTIHVYSLDELDSVALRKVDKTEVMTDLLRTTASIEELLKDKDAQDGYERIIASIEGESGVESVTMNGSNACIQVKDACKVFLIKDPGFAGADLQTAMQHRIASMQKAKAVGISANSRFPDNDLKVAFVSQFKNNQTRVDFNRDNEIWSDVYRECGIDCDFLDEIKKEFYQNELFDYDIVFLSTHGAYYQGKHWFMTTEEISVGGILDAWANPIRTTDMDDIAVAYVDEQRNGKTVYPRYIMVSEDYIAKSKKKFPHPHNAVVFANVCSSLEGNHNVASIMFNKGARSYIGYDNTCYHGWAAGLLIMKDLLDGYSLESAIDALEPELQVEKETEKARLIHCHVDDEKPYFMLPIVPQPVNMGDITYQADNTANIKFEAVTQIPLYSESDLRHVQFGIRYGSSLVSFSGFTANNTTPCYLETVGNKLILSNRFTMPQGVTFYYQFYCYDGTYYNVSDIQSFDVPQTLITSLTITEPATTMNVCEMKSIEYHFLPIDAANKNMEWSSSDPEIVVIDNNAIAIALKPGTCTLTVRTTDGSNLSASCVVTVKNQGGPSTDPVQTDGNTVTFNAHHTCSGERIRGFIYWEEGHDYARTFVNATNQGIVFTATVSGLKYDTKYYCMAACNHYEYTFNGNIVEFTLNKPAETVHEYVDLGLSVMWATHNVGANTPEQYGDFFTWGETKPKNRYTEDDILGTKDDAAHANWGDKWRLPTFSEIKELLDNTKCTWKWEQSNGVYGYAITSRKTGRSIFLPAGGVGYTSAPMLDQKYGAYWTSSEKTGEGPYSLIFNQTEYGWDYGNYYYGMLARPVFDTHSTTVLVSSITLSASTSTIQTGQQLQLSASVLPTNASNQTLSWSSSNPSVAAVTQTGLVTALKKGTTFISANATDGSDISALYYLTVTEAPAQDILIQSLTLTPSSCTLKIGEQKELGYSYMPYEATHPSVKWSSSNHAVANVSNGMVTAIGEGTCVITISAVEGNAHAECQVKVLKADEPVQYVDLGLPSGNLWATCNLGATKPEEYGHYYSWGETTPKNAGSHNDYAYWDKNTSKFTKYTPKAEYAVTIDGMSTLLPEDDAASVALGTGWHTPTPADFKELIQYCTLRRHTQRNGVYGALFTRNGHELFIPAAGFKTPSIIQEGKYAYCWSDSLSSTHLAYWFASGSEGCGVSGSDRMNAAPIRAVRHKSDGAPQPVDLLVTSINISAPSSHLLVGTTMQLSAEVSPKDATNKTISWTSEQPAVASVNASGLVTALTVGTATLTARSTDGSNVTSSYTITVEAKGAPSTHEYVDLGVSVKWATCNIGANAPEQPGDHFAWGETSPKANYSKENYKWSMGTNNSMTKYTSGDQFSNNGSNDQKTILDPEDDAAHVRWGGTWRTPTLSEILELRTKCNWTWEKLNGIEGYRITSKANGNSIFLPVTGTRRDSTLKYPENGYYWLSQLYGGRCNYAYELYFSSTGYPEWNWDYRHYGYAIRPVCP